MPGERSVVITGASSGLGAALAGAFARDGARLTLMARRADRLAEVAEGCGGAEVEAVEGDVTVPGDGERLVQAAVSAHGGIDCLVANAGVSMWSSFEEVQDLSLFRRLMEVNYLGAVHCVHPALPHLKDRRGQFVAISSIQGRVGVPQHTGYSASKHALQGFCDALRMELEGSGVNVLTVVLHWLGGTELREQAYAADGRPFGEGRRRPSRDAIGLEETCDAILRAVKGRRRELVMPWKLKALLAIRALRPRLAEAIVRRAVNRQGGEALGEIPDPDTHHGEERP